MSAATYLGERPVDLSTDTNYKDFSPSDWALYWIERYGQYDGSHHKQRCLDQVVRILKGAPVTAVIASWTDHEDEYRFDVGTCEAYEQWVEDMKGEKTVDEDGEVEYEYDYDDGISP